MKVSILGTFALVAGTFAAGPSFAQSGFTGGHPYVGIAAGGSHDSASCAAGVSCDNSDRDIKLYGGWEFPNNFAAELTYNDLGRFKASSDTGSSEAKGNYWGVGGAWLPEFGNGWGGVARVGAAYTTGKVDYSLVDSTSGSETRESWHPYYGLGLNYQIARNIKLEADWDNTRLATEALGLKSTDTVNTYTLGASFAF